MTDSIAINPMLSGHSAFTDFHHASTFPTKALEHFLFIYDTTVGDDDPSIKVWSVYLSEAALHDKALVESWSKDMDGILIFVGSMHFKILPLYLMHDTLLPDPNQQTIALLQQISFQLGGGSGQDQKPALLSFSPTSTALRVNTFWFLSLCLGLTCALAATLVQQWARTYSQAIERRPAPEIKARIRSYLYQGMEEFGMSAVVEGIPTLLHASVFLFFAGLVDFLYAINATVAIVTMSIVAACSLLYTVITWLPIINHKCPYRTPLSEVFWNLAQILSLLRFKDSGVWRRIDGPIWQRQEALACADLGRNQRDFECLSWTLESLTEDGKLISFAEGIPAFCSSVHGRDIMTKIVMSKKTQLIPRIISLLVRDQRTENSAFAISIICMDAITALCSLYSEDPWTFLFNFEFDLHSVIVPVTASADAQLASAARNVARKVANHIQSCILQHADRAQEHQIQAARMRSLLIAQKILSFDEPEFKWGFKLLRRWNSLVDILHLIPPLVCSPGDPIVLTSALSQETKSVLLCPEFVDALFVSFKLRRLFDLLEPCSHESVDLVNSAVHRECALACLKAYFYMTETVEWSAYLRTTGIKLLGHFSEDCASDAVSKYAICATVKVAAELQRAVLTSRDYSVITNVAFFCENTPDRNLHPTTTFTIKNIPEAMPNYLDMAERHMNWLLQQLPSSEVQYLQSIYEDGNKALGLCRGQVGLFIRLLERLGSPYASSVDALKLAYDVVRPMEPYLNARFSSRGDQTRLVKLCVDYTHTRGTFDRSNHQQFCLDELLLRVLGTIGDPGVIEKAKTAVHEYGRAASGKYSTSARIIYDQLCDIIPLPAIDDSPSEKSVCLPMQNEGSPAKTLEAMGLEDHVRWHPAAVSSDITMQDISEPNYDFIKTFGQLKPRTSDDGTERFS
ncbi:hypothetical protein HWV62_30783 [Athelia sp. TMB]|nr:hypothetical protein HWV62_30783 [Athelia sp. TMB]